MNMNKQSTLKKQCLTVLATVFLSLSTSAYAGGTCGKGKITEVMEGGWNSNDLMIKIDYTGGTSPLATQAGYIRFRDTLNAERLNGLRAVAYLALAGDKTVEALTHGANCADADQLSVLK